MKLQHETKIGDIEISSTLLDYDEAAEISFELVQKLAPLVQLFMGDELQGDTLQAAALPMIATAATSMKPAEWAALVRRLFARTTAIIADEKGERVKLDLHTPTARNRVFQGQVLASYRLVLFIIQINFADFIGALGQFGITAKGS